MPTQEELKFLRSQTLERKVRITQTRIAEWYEHYKGQVYVSFSGGKDSTVLLDLARRMYPDIEAVFVDTGLEYPEIRDFVKTFDNVTVLRPKMQFKEVIEHYGYPIISKEVAKVIKDARQAVNNGKTEKSYAFQQLRGKYINPNNGEPSPYNKPKWMFLMDAPFKISNQCCDIMKKKPIHNYEKNCNKKAIIGTMTDESQQREARWMIYGCNSFNQKDPQSAPMSFWTEQDVLHYIKLFNIPYASVYGDIVPKAEFKGQLAFDEVPTDLMTTGCQRTGCMFCGFGAHLEAEPNRFQMMKLTHPKQYDYCMREENGLGLAKVLDYIGVKY